MVELRVKDPVRADGDRLVGLDELPLTGVIEVETGEHGVLAVGMADGEPFATSNTCRHQLTRIGRGRVHGGVVECPWHRARYDVRTGRMVSGPQGTIFGSPRDPGALKTVANVAWRIRTYPVELRDGAIWLKS